MNDATNTSSAAGAAAPAARAGAESSASRPAAAGERGPVQKDDLLRFVWIADPRISPDGSRIAFTRVWVDAEADTYRTQIWITDSAGGTPRPLTSGLADAQPRWSPDGTRIAFVRSPGPKQPGQLYVLPMTGGEAQRVCELAKGAAEPAWSPDGKRIAFLSATNPALDDPKQEKPKHEPGRVITKPVFRENDRGWIEADHQDHVWVVDVPERGARDATPRALTCGEYAATSPRWSRDGRHVLFAADRRPEPWFGPERSVLYAVSPALEAPTDGAALTPVVDFGGAIAAWTEHTDGRIALVGFQSVDPPRTYQIPRLLVTQGEWPRSTVRDLSAACDDEIGGAINSDQHPPRGGGVSPLAFVEDGRAVLVAIAREGSSMLARVDTAGGGMKALMPAGHDLIAGTASDDGKTWALTLGGPNTPGDLHRFDAATGKLVKLWSPNEALLAERALGTIEEFWFPSFDGTKVHCWLMKPPDFDPKRTHPLVLEIHGGPHTAYGWGFFHEFHALAGAGYLVLYTNPRGSTSYGEGFATSIQYRFPDEDARDLLAAVDEVVKRGYVDTARLGVTGGSGGGLLTNWIVTQTDRFAAAVTQRCVADWASFYYSADFAMFTPFWFKKPPYEDPEEYLARSPVALASKITTPLMVIHSEEDWRTPIGQGEAMFRALKQQKKPAVMVRFPGESHELSRSGVPSRRVQNQHHIRAWFDRWLLGKPAPEYGV